MKRKKQNFELPEDIPNRVKIKENTRNIQKIKKPLYQTLELIDYDTKLGVIKVKDNNKKFRINKIKRPRRFIISEASVPKKT